MQYPLTTAELVHFDFMAGLEGAVGPERQRVVAVGVFIAAAVASLDEPPWSRIHRGLQKEVCQSTVFQVAS